MYIPRARILDFDGSVTSQSRFMAEFQPAVVDLRRLGPLCRFWANERAANEVRNALRTEWRGVPTFLGSGDFHHISALLVEQFSEPITVIVFDHHPDWDVLPPRLGCGSWVSAILKRPNVCKVVLLGISSDDISNYSIQTGNLSALENDRVEIYPISHAPSRVLLQTVPDNASIQVERSNWVSTIRWRQIQEMDPAALFAELGSRITTKKVYVSVDKDCLRSQWSLSNWEEGLMDFGFLMKALRWIKDRFEIVGFDVIGDFSPIRTKGLIKTVASRLDHPRRFSAAGKTLSDARSVNEETNLALLQLFA